MSEAPADVCVHGLGYIGLPTAATFADAGYDVVGFDTDEEVVATLDGGDVHIDEPGLADLVTEGFASGALSVADEPVEADCHVVCVPTPFDPEEKAAGLQFVEKAGEAVAALLRPGDLVVLESTVPPGTTEGTLRPILERSGLTAGEDFRLAHCPETVLPGNMIAELRENDRIVGGVDEASTAAAAERYRSFVEGEIRRAPDPTTAEFVKLVQNTFRDVNIALANEVAKLAHDYGVDSREAIELANTHPRVDLLRPGPGVGGHCLPVDPWFLGQDSDRLGLIERAREVNDGMSGFIRDLLRDELGSLAGRRIAVLGVAYKGNVGDTRKSPGLKLARELQAAPAVDEARVTADGGAGASVALHDPHVTDQTLRLEPLAEALDGADAAVVAADHDEYEDLDPARVRERMAGSLVVDAMGVLDEDDWTAEGVTVRRV